MSTYSEGDTVIFNGYTDLEPGQPEILSAGDALRIVTVLDDGSLNVVKVGDEETVDTLFDTEVSPMEPEVEAAPKPAPAKGKKTAPAAAPKTAAEMVAAAKAKTASKTTKGKKGKAKEQAPEPPAPELELETESAIVATPEPPKPPKPLTPVVVPPATPSLSELALQSDEEALATANSLTNRIQETFWSLGGVLVYIREHASYKLIADENGQRLYDGKYGFRDYVEKELSLKYNRAMYYVRIHNHYAPLGVTAEQIEKIGWAKASEMLKVVDATNLDEWMGVAEKNSREDLRAIVAKSQVQAGDGSEEQAPTTATLTKVTFKLFGDQGNVLQEALSQAKAQIGEDDDNKALAYILTEFISLQDGNGQRTCESMVRDAIAVWGREAVLDAVGVPTETVPA